MSRLSPPSQTPQTATSTGLQRPTLPLLLYDLGAANQLLPSAAVLPEQFYSSPRTGESQRGEVALMQAVLEDAIVCFQKQFVREGRRVLRLAQEAEEWFAADDLHWPFSFINVCAVLGLEPDYIRRGLKQWREQHASESKEESEITSTTPQSLQFAAKGLCRRAKNRDKLEGLGVLKPAESTIDRLALVGFFVCHRGKALFCRCPHWLEYQRPTGEGHEWSG